MQAETVIGRGSGSLETARKAAESQRLFNRLWLHRDFNPVSHVIDKGLYVAISIVGIYGVIKGYSKNLPLICTVDAKVIGDAFTGYVSRVLGK